MRKGSAPIALRMPVPPSATSTDLEPILRTLREHLFSLQTSSPYYQVRLLRITQQLEYVVCTWPPAQWPAPQVAAPRLLREARRSVPSSSSVCGSYSNSKGH